MVLGTKAVAGKRDVKTDAASAALDEGLEAGSKPVERELKVGDHGRTWFGTHIE